MRFPIFGLGQTGKSVTVSAESRTNLYAELGDDKAKIAFYNTPGLDLFDSFGDTPVRGALELGDFNYVVHRGTFWQQNNSAVKVSRGTLLTTSGRVSLATNGNIIQIVDGTYAYTYNTTTTTFAQVLDADFVPAVTNTWIDGYFITDQRGSTDVTKHQRYSWSTDGSTYDALNFAAAEASPDKLQRAYNDNRQLILFGEYTTEFHNSSGNSDLPFSRTATNEWGLAAINSIAKMNDSIIYLGQNRMGKTQVIVLNGYTPQIISNNEFSSIIDSYGNVSNASGYSIMIGGHPFYYLSFPSVSKTWMFDGSTNLWSKINSGLIEGQHRAIFSNNFIGRSLGYDYTNGNVYEFNPDSYTDNGDMIVRELTSRHVFDEGYISVNRLQIDLEAGVGLPSGQGSDPQIMLRISKDGGQTYPVERWTSFGAIGKYLTRAYWDRIGISRDFIFTVRITDPVKVAINGAYIDT